jgi:hypothetical protein
VKRGFASETPGQDVEENSAREAGAGVWTIEVRKSLYLLTYVLEYGILPNI